MITEQQIEKMREMKRQGAKLNVIAKVVGISRAMVTYYTRGIPSAHMRLPMPEEKQERIRSLRAQGKTYDEIAKEMGLSISTISNICKGIKKPKPIKPKKPKPKVIDDNDDEEEIRCYEVGCRVCNATVVVNESEKYTVCPDCNTCFQVKALMPRKFDINLLISRYGN